MGKSGDPSKFSKSIASSARIRVSSTLAGAALVACLVAQTPLSFEVAAVKPNKSGSTRSGTRTATLGRFEATNITVRQLVIEAFKVRPLQVVGGPNWLDSEHFDIVARTPDDAPPNRMYEMVRSLLADRFKLIVHTETREQPVCALVLARADRRLSPGLVPGECSGRNCGLNTTATSGSGTMTGVGQTMQGLAAAVSNLVDRIVIDRTGISDTYDFELRFSRDDVRNALPADAPPSIFTALPEQLGLKLERARGPVEFIVIDRAERPSED